MSIPRRHPIVEVGDAGGLYSAWRVTGLNDRNSDRGALYAKFTPAGVDVLVEVFKDFERTTLVASGTGPIGRVTATAVVLGSTSSGLTVSVVVTANTATSAVVLHVQLASEADLREAEDDAEAFRSVDPPAVDFTATAKRVMTQFYLNIQADFPPPQREARPLAYHGINQEQVAGRRGLPDTDAIDLWSLNTEGDWELTGLQNIGDYKEWAIAWSLWLLWKRKSGGFEDPMFKRALAYKQEAAEQWRLLAPQVDRTGDGLPERAVRRQTPMIRRG